MELREILRAIKAAENLPMDAALAQILSQLYSEVAFRCFSPRAFEKALSFGVFNAEVAALCNKYGRFEIAAEIYTALLNTAPRDASLWFGLGNALSFLESSKAESAYFKALDSLTPSLRAAPQPSLRGASGASNEAISILEPVPTPSLRASGVATSVAINNATEGDALKSRTDFTSGLPRDGVAIARNDDSNACHANDAELPTSRHCEQRCYEAISILESVPTPSLRASGVATSVAINSATEGDALESRTDSTSGLPRYADCVRSARNDGVKTALSVDCHATANALSRNDDSNANHASCAELPTSRHCEKRCYEAISILEPVPTPSLRASGVATSVAINNTTEGDALKSRTDFTSGLPRYADCVRSARNDGVKTALSVDCHATANALSRNDDSIAPAIHTNLAFFYFNCGAFEKAFKHYEARKNLANYKTPIQKINANPRAEQILIYCEQGFGDSIMFGRFLRGLKSQKITCLIQPELLELFKNALPHIHFTADIAEAESTPFKAAHSLLSLPFIYGFNTPLDFALFPNAKTTETNTIAICANSNSPLSRTKNAHKNTLLNFIKKEHPHANILDFSSDNLKNLGVKNFAQTARLLKNAAKIYSIDSALLHLGASLAIPSVALLNHDLKWRFKKNLWYKNIEILPLKNFQKRT